MTEKTTDKADTKAAATRKTKTATPKCNVDPTFEIPKSVKNVEEYLATHVIFEYEDNVYATPLGEEIINTMQNPVKKIKKLHISEFSQMARDAVLADESRSIKTEKKNTPWKLHEISLQDFEYFYNEVGYVFRNGQPDEVLQTAKAKQLMSRFKNLTISGNIRITRFINAPKDNVLFTR